ncbi:MAG: hypothetical protein AABW81_00230 [Nanoarchaeota archaeon]
MRTEYNRFEKDKNVITREMYLLIAEIEERVIDRVIDISRGYGSKSEIYEDVNRLMSIELNKFSSIPF